MEDHIFHDFFNFEVSCYSKPYQMLGLEQIISTIHDLTFPFSYSTIISPWSKTFHNININTMLVFELSLDVFSNLQFSVSVIVPSGEKLSLLEAFDFKLLGIADFSVLPCWHNSISLFQR